MGVPVGRTFSYFVYTNFIFKGAERRRNSNGKKKVGKREEEEEE